MAKFKTTAGDYRTRVVIEQATESTNAVGEVELTWSTYATRWAKAEPLFGREFQEAMQIVAAITTGITLRSDAQTRAITPKMRLKIGTRLLNIVHVKDAFEARREVIVWCIEEVAT